MSPTSRCRMPHVTAVASLQLASFSSYQWPGFFLLFVSFLFNNFKSRLISAAHPVVGVFLCSLIQRRQFIGFSTSSLSTWLSSRLPLDSSIRLSIHPTIGASVGPILIVLLSVYLSELSSFCLSVRLSVRSCVRPSICPSAYLSVSPSVSRLACSSVCCLFVPRLGRLSACLSFHPAFHSAVLVLLSSVGLFVCLLLNLSFEFYPSFYSAVGPIICPSFHTSVRSSVCPYIDKLFGLLA